MPGRGRLLLNDGARLALRPLLARQARRSVGAVDVLYERQSTFQALGRGFQRRGAFWVVESNGPFWYEASTERRNLALGDTARRTELAAYREADLVVVVSEALKEIVIKHSGRDERDVLVVPNATDAERFDPSTVVPVRQFDLPTLGFCGYLVRWAGVDLALEALSRLRRRGVDLAFTVIGEGPDRADLERATSALGLEDRVAFLGRVPWSAVPAHLAGMDIGYSGQRRMAIGRMYHSPQKLYEYMAMGLPFVASDHADARTMAASGCGWTFQDEDVDDLVTTLAAAIGDAPGRDRAGRRARRVLLAEHTWRSRVLSLVAELRERGVPVPTAPQPEASADRSSRQR
jgi:glycosyltransferase involved in cell wall biosynthesis